MWDSLKNWPAHRITAPGSGVNPPARVRSQGAQRTFDFGTSQPLSLRCLSMNVTAGPDFFLKKKKRKGRGV